MQSCVSAAAVFVGARKLPMLGLLCLVLEAGATPRAWPRTEVVKLISSKCRGAEVSNACQPGQCCRDAGLKLQLLDQWSTVLRSHKGLSPTVPRFVAQTPMRGTVVASQSALAKASNRQHHGEARAQFHQVEQTCTFRV